MTAKTITTTVIATAAVLSLALAVPVNANPQRMQAKANFVAADMNQDEHLDMAEFTTFVNLNADHNLGRAAMIRRFGMYGRAFGTLDANRDGVVSKAEIAARARR